MAIKTSNAVKLREIVAIPDEIIDCARRAEAEQSAKLTPDRKLHLIRKVKKLLKQQDAVLVAHYYTSWELQKLAEDTGGFVADSLEMARFGSNHPATTLVVAGVRFMGETAKILNPEKRILMPDTGATCSLDLSCPVDMFSQYCDEHPDHTVVVYANTSAAVKARADWVVTSGIALPVVEYLAQKGEKILWAPDKHLGSYVRNLTGVEMLIWPGSCIVHEKFKSEGIKKLQQKHPEAKILVHPESPREVIQIADVVGSTTALIKASKTLDAMSFIVATEPGIFYKMRQASPEKLFLEAPTGGISATCESCLRCPWMGMNGLRNLAGVLESGENEITVDEAVRKKAVLALNRMMDFAKKRHFTTKDRGNA